MRRRRRLNGDEEVEELADLGDPGESNGPCLFNNDSIKPLLAERKLQDHLHLPENVQERLLVDYRQRWMHVCKIQFQKMVLRLWIWQLG